MAQERLQKLLAQAGVASRRAAEELILKGRVRVNGRIVRELGTRADLHKDRVEVDGRRLVAERPAYYLLHKPREMVTTLNDPEGRQSLSKVLERVAERCFPVGRLDYHTSGALLLTNDGEMTDALLHPTQGVPKAYIAKMKGVVAEQALQSLRNGVTLDDGYTTAKAEVFVVREDRGNSWLSITIREGKNRQIHRMGDAVGHRVMRLSRSSFAGLSVEGMRPGAMRPLSTKEIDKLKKDYLNPKRRRKANQQRHSEAEANAEFFDGWGEDVVNEPAAPRAARPARSGGTARASTGSRSAAGASASRTNPTAARAVRALEERRAPKSRSIGGGREESKPAAKKKTTTKSPAAKPAAAKSTARKPAATKSPAAKPTAGKPAATKKPAPPRSAAKKTTKGDGSKRSTTSRAASGKSRAGSAGRGRATTSRRAGDAAQGGAPKRASKTAATRPKGGASTSRKAAPKGTGKRRK